MSGSKRLQILGGLKGPVSILTQPTSRAVALGEVAYFPVVASGKGLTYKWQYMLTTDTVWRDTSMEGNTTDTLIVEGKTSRSGYKYHCIITDESGNTVTSNAVTLTVKQRFGIIDHPKSITAPVGETVAFTVAAEGEGLTYKWQWYKEATSSWGDTTVEGNTTSSIRMEATESRNGYKYRCVITDKNGNTLTSAEAVLTVVTYSKLNGYKFTVPVNGSVDLVSLVGTGWLYGILSCNAGFGYEAVFLVSFNDGACSAKSTIIADFGDSSIFTIAPNDAYTEFTVTSTLSASCTFIPLM